MAGGSSQAARRLKEVPAGRGPFVRNRLAIVLRREEREDMVSLSFSLLFYSYSRFGSVSCVLALLLLFHVHKHTHIFTHTHTLP